MKRSSVPRQARLGGVMLAAVLAGSSLSAQQPDTRGADISGVTRDRDNTRVQGTVLDSSGQPLNEVQIWVTNHEAPADRVRAKTRKTGEYLVRNLARLYTRDDLYGITLRVTFERNGYRPVEVAVAVEKNGIQRLLPILHREDEAVEMTGVSALLAGTVTNARGKPVKSGTVRVTARGGAEALAESAIAKGEFEALLWQAPSQVTVLVSSPLGDKEMEVDLQPPPRPDVVLPQILEISYQE